MNSRITLLCALIIASVSAFGQTTSAALLGSCIVSDSSIVRFAWNSGLQCDLEGDLSDVTEFGVHSGYNSWAGSVPYDDPYATTAVRSGASGDTVRWAVQLDDYFGYTASLITEINIVLNRGVSDPDPWSAAARDTGLVDGPFGLGCPDLILFPDELMECPTPGPVDTGGTDTTSTGLQIAELSEYMHVLPNPATEDFVISFQNPGALEVEFLLTDLTGRVVRSQTGLRDDRVEVMRGDLSRGTYIAVLRSTDGRMSARRVLLQ